MNYFKTILITTILLNAYVRGGQGQQGIPITAATAEISNHPMESILGKPVLGQAATEVASTSSSANAMANATKGTQTQSHPETSAVLGHPITESSSAPQPEIPPTAPAPTPIPEVKVPEKTALEQWNDHLALLTSNNENWDAAGNHPTSSWKDKAFELAKAVIEKDKTIAESLKSSFMNTLNAKTTTFANIKNLIKEFDDFIDDLLKSSAPASTAPPAPIIIPAPEVPVHVEPAPDIKPEQPATPETSTTSAPTTEGATTTSETTDHKDINQQWQDELNKIKKEGKNWSETNTILENAHKIGNELVEAGSAKQKLLSDFESALKIRQRSNVYPLAVKATLAEFDRMVGMPLLPQSGPGSYLPENAIEREQLLREQKEHAAMLQAEKEKEKQKEQEILVMKKALQDIKGSGKIGDTRVHEMEAKLASMEQKWKAALAAERLAQEKNRKEEIDALRKSAKQLKNTQEAEADKGWFSTALDWLWGTNKNEIEMENLKHRIRESLYNLAIQYPQATQALKEFELALLGLDRSKYWDKEKQLPTQRWIAHMSDLLITLMVNQHVFKDTEAFEFIKIVLGMYMPKNKNAITKIIADIRKPVDDIINHNIATEKEQEAVKLTYLQQKKEQKEQVALALLRAKEAEERKIAEEARQRTLAANYKQEKQQLHTLFGTIAQNKRAKPEQNYEHTQQALKKSQTILQLADDIPTKNKTAISQKLKNKFTVALLDQQKNGEQQINVHHNMDMFNRGINRLVD